MTTELSQPSRSIGRLAWALCAIILAATVVFALVQLRVQPPENIVQVVANLLQYIAFTVFGVTGALIVSRQPRNPVGWLLLLEGALAIAMPVDLFFMNLATPPAQPSALFLIGLWLWGGSWLLYIFPIPFILLYFPTGRPPSRRWRWLAVFGLALCAFFLLFTSTLKEWQTLSDYGWSVRNPIGIHDLPFPMAPWAVALITFIGLSVVSLFVRYRRAPAVERQQIKWLLYAAGLFFVIYAAGFALNVDSETSGSAGDLVSLLLGLGVLVFPIAVGIAILRYRLYDIDVVIRKTLVYAALTALLALVYFGSVILLQSLFGALAGIEQSTLAVVISTLMIAALFSPLRRRLQDTIDRRFFRKKYDAQQVLARFAQTARDETDLDALLAELVRVVDETLQPEQVSVWLRPAIKSVLDDTPPSSGSL